MRSPKSTLLTVGLAVVLIIGLWLVLREEPAAPPSADPSPRTAGRRSPDTSATRTLPDRTRERRDEGDDRSTTRPRPRRFGERAPVEAETDDDGERALFEAKIEALHRWRIDTRRQLMTCLPPPSLEVQPHELRVVFEPLPDAPEGTPRRLVVARFEPGPGLEEPSELVIPEEVQKCLDQLVGSPLELPEGSSELEEGYQESIDVPWG